MLFLADESCDHAVVRALRGAGHQVASIAEDAPGTDDDLVLELARREGQVVLTEDKDFGQLVYASARETGGVVFLRFPAGVRKALPGAAVETVARLGEELIGAFVVIEPGGVRVRRGSPRDALRGFVGEPAADRVRPREGGDGMIKLIDKATGRELGEVTKEQFQALVDVLEEESDEDTDYYINTDTLDLLREANADPALIDILERGLAGREDMDIQWRRVV